MPRLDKERQKELEPKRMEFAEEKLAEMGIVSVRATDSELEFEWRGNTIKFFPYSGWFQGAGIASGWGINALIKRLKEQKKHVFCECGAIMAKRKNRQNGSQFYGCTRFPKCTGTKPIK